MKNFFTWLKKVNEHGLVAGLFILALLIPSVAFVASVNNSTISTSKAAYTVYYPPKITSIPPQSVTVGETYTYKIAATDPQGLALSYGILTYPQYKEVNLTGTTITAAFPKPGIYPLVIYVTNGHNSTPQGVAINVLPKIEGTGNSNNGVVQAATAPIVSITTPNASTTYGGTQNKIIWSATSPVGISKVDLYYSLDGSTWKEIIKSFTGNTSTFTWDTSSIADGQYFLRIDAIDRSQNPLTASAISPKFTIKNPLPPDKQQQYTEADEPSFTKSSYQPADGDTIYETAPTIKVDYEPGKDTEIDALTSKVKIDDIEVPADIGQRSLNYKVTDPLATGPHKVSVTLKNKKGLEKTTEWSFSIISSANPQTNPNQDSNTQTVLGLNPILGTGIIIILVILFILLVIFVIFKLLELIRGKQKDDEITQITNYYAPQPTEPVGPETIPYTTTTEQTINDQTGQVSDDYNPYVNNTYYQPTETQEPVQTTTTETVEHYQPVTNEYQTTQVVEPVAPVYEQTETTYVQPQPVTTTQEVAYQDPNQYDTSHFYGANGNQQDQTYVDPSQNPYAQPVQQDVNTQAYDPNAPTTAPYNPNYGPIDYNVNPNTEPTNPFQAQTTQPIEPDQNHQPTPGGPRQV